MTKISDRLRYFLLFQYEIIDIRDINKLLKRMNMQENNKYINRSEVKALIAILIDGPFYLTIPLRERFSLIKRIIEEYQFSGQEHKGASFYEKVVIA